MGTPNMVQELSLKLTRKLSQHFKRFQVSDHDIADGLNAVGPATSRSDRLKACRGSSLYMFVLKLSACGVKCIFLSADKCNMRLPLPLFGGNLIERSTSSSWRISQLGPSVDGLLTVRQVAPGPVPERTVLQSADEAQRSSRQERLHRHDGSLEAVQRTDRGPGITRCN
jgi:hypothetical protein